MYTGNQTSYENLNENMKQKLGELKTPIVNDLTTGGSDKALSAESGKELKSLVDKKADSKDLESLKTEVTEHLVDTKVHITPEEKDKITKVMTGGNGYQMTNNADFVKNGVASLKEDGVNHPPASNDGWSTIVAFSPFLDNADRSMQLAQSWNANDTQLWYRRHQNGSYKSWAPVSIPVAPVLNNGQNDEDPNTTIKPLIITQHANVQNPNEPTHFWYVETIWYGNHNSQQKMQRATRYHGGVSSTKTRHCYQDVWAPWSVDTDRLFQSVSSGKAQVANAITGKGVQTATDAEFATMAKNIDLIQTGLKSATGIGSSSGGKLIISNAFQFVPQIILVKYQLADNRWDDFSVYVNKQVLNSGDYYGIDAYRFTTIAGAATNDGYSTVSFGGFTIHVVGGTDNPGLYYWQALGN